jgi:phosphate transport system substrate-binding protein
MRKLLPLLAALTLAACSSESQEPAVWAAGSSTVFPFASRVAENMARKTGRPAPRIESLGTGGGIKAFCDGAGPGTPDIAMASRRMKQGEWDDCRQAGVVVAELRVGADGVVVATDRQGSDYQLTLEQLYQALADELPTADGRFIPNPHRTWRDVGPELPAVRIQVYGPPPTSGTRDAFVELAMDAGAEEIPAMAALKERDEDAFQARARTLREDGGWVDSGENDNALLQTLTRTPGSLGVFGFSFLGQNRDRVKAAAINGVQPTTAAISNGDYPLARTLYLYVKKNSLGRTPGLRPYLAEFLSEAASGKGGYLVDQGMIPLSQPELVASRALVPALPDMPRPE